MEEKYYGIEYVWEIWGDNPHKKKGFIYQFEKPTYRKFWLSGARGDEEWRKREILSADEVNQLEQACLRLRSSKVQKSISSEVPKFRSSEV